MLYSSPSRRPQALSIARSTRAVLAIAVTAGLSVPLAIHPSQAEEAVTAEAFLANLVNEVTTSKNAVNDLELEMGGLREGANKARVDLDHARQKAQDAQNNVVDARGRLDSSDKAVTDAQKDLDQIARSAYTAGGDAAPVNLAAGADAVTETLDRSSYIRMATERQQNTVDQLDLARTQTANEESTLRTNRNDANSAVTNAIDAHNAARDALNTAQQQVREKSAALEQLIKDRDLAQKRLDAARSAVNTLANTNPKATSFDKRRVAEAAADKAEGLSQTASTQDSDATSKAPKSPADTAEQTSDKAPSSTLAAPATSPAPAADDEQSATGATESSSTASGTNAPAASTPATTGPASPATPYAGTADALPAIEGDAPDFSQSSAGDKERQLAIDGLLRAGGAAAMAGFNSYAQDGDQGNAANAALTAGRQAAGEQYDQAQAGLNPTTPVEGEDLSEVGEGAGTEDESTGSNPSSGSGSNGSGSNGSGSNGSGSNADSSVNTSGTAAEKIERVINRGMSQLGVTYSWGGGNQYGPTLGIRDGGVADSFGDYAKVGFDCSGLTLYAFAAVGIQLDHYSGNQYTAGRQVPTSEIKRGDMLFWGAGGSQHVSIYLGDGKMLEAPQSGSSVQVSDVRYAGMTPMAVRMIE